MPTGQVEFGDCHEALYGVVDGGEVEKGLWVSHEVGDSFEHAAWFQDEGGEGDSAEIGARPELGYDVGEDIALFGADDLNVFAFAVSCFFDRRAGAATSIFTVPVAQHHDGFSVDEVAVVDLGVALGGQKFVDAAEMVRYCYGIDLHVR